MQIYQNFTGANIRIVGREGAAVLLDNELRDTTEDWFYWAFGAQGEPGETVTFRFPINRIGPFGPAISHDLKNWTWLGAGTGEDENSFSYTFSKGEETVYFAHDMLYHPERFFDFAREHRLEVRELCRSRGGRSVPYVTFGEGEHVILMTARHHACEATGSYVLEGVLESLLARPMKDIKVVCVPFVDYDGVVDGDQGKARAPHDHNRDYPKNTSEPSLYPETAAIRKIAEKGVLYGFDFHSPWHRYGENDTAFVVRKSTVPMSRFERFAQSLESSMTVTAFQYRAKNDFPPDTAWNKSEGPCFANYMMNDMAKADIAFTLETAYFGTPDNIFTQDGAVELGRCFAEAIRRYHGIC